MESRDGVIMLSLYTSDYVRFLHHSVSPAAMGEYNASVTDSGLTQFLLIIVIAD